MKTLQLGISEFALPSPRSGHIEAYSGYGGLPNLGSAIHADIQARRLREHPGYLAEKWITHSFEHDGYKVTVSGRMDGFVFGAPVLIEEIKSAYNAAELIQSLDSHPHHPYKLQLRTYGFLQWLQSGGCEPRLNLHVVSARSREARDIEIELAVADYQAWLARRLKELVEEQKGFEALARRRKKLAKEFVFPFPFPRPGQRELMGAVKDAVTGGRRLLLQAPTGLGKTAGVLFPTLQESMARGQKTIYLTAKNSQHEVAEDAVRRLQETGVKLRSVSIHAKAKMCLKEEPHCNPHVCEFARNHYDKVAAHGLPAKMIKKKRLTARTFRKLALTHEVCPFELQMEAAAHADVVIADYNYVFAPRNCVSRLTHNGWTGAKSRPNLVVDEIHNLPARANEYFSAAVSCDDLGRLAQAAPEEVHSLARSVIDALRDLVGELTDGDPSEPRRVEIRTEHFAPVHSLAQELLARYLESGLELRAQDPVLRLCNEVSAFAQTLELMNEDFFITAVPSPAGGTLKLTCCNASAWLKESYDHFSSMTGFSATLKPFDYYQRLLGLDTDGTNTAEFTSPFPSVNRKLLLIPQISTKMRDRAANYGKIKDSIERILAVRPGNYFVFFPSFDFMNKIFQMVDLPGFRALCQTRDMRRETVARYLDMLREEVPTAIFAVQGGVFAEGVDYPGDMLIGALIIGPALPTFDFERELLREYYEKKYGHGFDYAYTYPAMARVIQSAGRVIRSAEDRGLIVLMDRRFTFESYRKSMPQDWIESEPLVSTQILGDVRRFWEKSES